MLRRWESVSRKVSSVKKGVNVKKKIVSVNKGGRLKDGSRLKGGCSAQGEGSVENVTNAVEDRKKGENHDKSKVSADEELVGHSRTAGEVDDVDSTTKKIFEDLK